MIKPVPPSWLALAAVAAVVSHQAALAKAVDMVPTASLNLPTMDCFKSFPEYRHKKSGWTYYNASIDCTTLSAFITYDHRSHDSSSS